MGGSESVLASAGGFDGDAGNADCLGLFFDVFDEKVKALGWTKIMHLELHFEGEKK